MWWVSLYIYILTTYTSRCGIFIKFLLQNFCITIRKMMHFLFWVQNLNTNVYRTRIRSSFYFYIFLVDTVKALDLIDHLVFMLVWLLWSLYFHEHSDFMITLFLWALGFYDHFICMITLFVWSLYFYEHSDFLITLFLWALEFYDHFTVCVWSLDFLSKWLVWSRYFCERLVFMLTWFLMF